MQLLGIRTTFGFLFGILAAILIGALPCTTTPKAMTLSSAFAIRFSPALPNWIIVR